MILLPSDLYSHVHDLFAPVAEQHIFCAGVLGGHYEGQVYVDNIESPQTGLLSKGNFWLFLVGNPDNMDFSRALNTAMYDRSLIGEKGWGCTLACEPPDAWSKQISAIYAPRTPIIQHRRHYICRAMSQDWRSQLPDGYMLHFIDESLESFENSSMVSGTIKERADVDNPDETAMGYAAVHNGKIIGYCVIESIFDGAGDVSLYTDGGHRRRGLAWLMSAAIMEYGLAHGLHTIHWDCLTHNAGSVRTAEKLGLTFLSAYPSYTFLIDPVIHEINRTWGLLNAGQYADALVMAQKNIHAANGSAHAHFHYIVARCHAVNGQIDDVMAALKKAAAAGWNDPGEASTDFRDLTGHAAWSGILQQMRDNVAQG